MEKQRHSDRFLNMVDDATSSVNEINVQELAKKMESKEKFYLVDVREDCEWQAGRLFNATHIARGRIECDIESHIPDSKADIVLYCRGGYRSLLAAAALQKMGSTRVKSLAGGFAAWVEAGFEYDGHMMDPSEQQKYYETEQNEATIRPKPWNEE